MSAASSGLLQIPNPMGNPGAPAVPGSQYIAPPISYTPTAGGVAGTVGGVEQQGYVGAGQAATEQQLANAANAAQNAGPITTPVSVGSGSFAVTPPPPVTNTNPVKAGGINQFSADLPWITAQENAANQQQYAEEVQGLQALTAGYGGAIQQENTLGASEQQQIQQQEQLTEGQNTAAMANAGLQGSTIQASNQASAQRTANLAATSNIENIASVRAQTMQSYGTALANFLAAPSYTNDVSTLLQGMEAQSNYQLSVSSLQQQQNEATAANSTALYTAGIGAAGSLLGGAIKTSAAAGAAGAA